MKRSEIESLPFLAGGLHERADFLRRDDAALEKLMQHDDARLIRVDGAGAGHFARHPIPAGGDRSEYCFIGFDEEVRPLFADAAPGEQAAGSFLDRSSWQRLASWPRIDAGLLATAQTLVDWHRRHRYCAVCGHASEMRRAGWMRECPSCSAQHFPRVDPVVIMLAEHDGRVLLGRQPRFPKNHYSALAGFIEPGEGVEDAVVRELHEEAGIRAHSVRYVASQPWPFPSQLMIGCFALCDDPRLTIDETEIEHAFWATRAEVEAAVEQSETASFTMPPPLAIAHHLIIRWLSGD